MGSPFSGQGCVLQPAIVPKAIPPSGGIGSGPSRGVTLLWDKYAWGLPTFARYIALHTLLLCIPSGCDHPLGHVCLFVTLDHERRITLVVVPSRCGHPFGSCGRVHPHSIGSSELLVAGGSPGLICCYARSLGYGLPILWLYARRLLGHWGSYPVSFL